jgi:hypothetical protein
MILKPLLTSILGMKNASTAASTTAYIVHLSLEGELRFLALLVKYTIVDDD